MDSDAGFNSHERVVQKIRFGPYDRHGQHCEELGFTAFDLTVKSEVIHWNATRKRLIEECNSTETEVRTVNLQFILALSGMLLALVGLRMLQQHGLAKNEGSTAEMLERKISNSSMLNMVGLIVGKCRRVCWGVCWGWTDFCVVGFHLICLSLLLVVPDGSDHFMHASNLVPTAKTGQHSKQSFGSVGGHETQRVDAQRESNRWFKRTPTFKGSD